MDHKRSYIVGLLLLGLVWSAVTGQHVRKRVRRDAGDEGGDEGGDGGGDEGGEEDVTPPPPTPGDLRRQTSE